MKNSIRKRNNTNNSKIHILQVGPLPPPYGGGAIALQMIINCPVLNEFDQQVFKTSRDEPTEEVGRKTITLQRMFRRLKLTVQLAFFLRRTKIDIVHFHCGSESCLDIIGYFLMVWCSYLTSHCRWIIHLHNVPALSDLPGRSIQGKWLFRRMIKPADAVITLTDESKQYLYSCSVNKRICVIPNMCNEELMKLPIEKEDSSIIRVIFLGRLTREKGFFDLLKAAAALKENQEIKFEVAGPISKKEDEDEIRHLIKTYHIEENLRLLGVVTGDEKIALFKRAHIMLFPSHHESFGIVAIEAMAAGLPMITTNIGGLKSIVLNNETGFIIEPGDINAMKNRILALASDQAMRMRLGNAGRLRFKENYSAVKIGGDLAEIYHKILS